MLKTCWNHVEIMLKSCWNHVEIMLKSCWNHVEIMLKSCWNQFEIMLKSCWNHVDKQHFCIGFLLKGCQDVLLSPVAPLGPQGTQSMHMYTYTCGWASELPENVHDGTFSDLGNETGDFSLTKPETSRCQAAIQPGSHQASQPASQPARQPASQAATQPGSPRP